MTDAIRFENVSVTFDGHDTPVLRHVDLAIDQGELVLVVGRTGSGKSTLLGAINGLVPHFTGGRLDGRVIVQGLDTRDHRPRDLAGHVGVVGQDPLAGFVSDTVEEELAYGMEQLGLPTATMRKRVEETLDLLGITDLRDAYYAGIAVLAGLLYVGLSPSVERRAPAPKVPLAKSRGIVLRLSLLFSLDSLGGGFVIQTLLALWLFRRFEFSIGTTSIVFFAMNLSWPRSRSSCRPHSPRAIGLIKTMVYTHLPANAFLVAAAFMPTAPWAITFLLLRMSLSQMDLPGEAIVRDVGGASRRALGSGERDQCAAEPRRSDHPSLGGRHAYPLLIRVAPRLRGPGQESSTISCSSGSFVRANLKGSHISGIQCDRSEHPEDTRHGSQRMTTARWIGVAMSLAAACTLGCGADDTTGTQIGGGGSNSGSGGTPATSPDASSSGAAGSVAPASGGSGNSRGVVWRGWRRWRTGCCADRVR